jgi:hypothetical protein
MNILEKMIENLGEIFDLLASNLLKISLSFAILSWLALLLPQSVFEYLSILTIRNSYIDVIGVIAFISSYLVILWLAYSIITLAYSYFRALFELPRLTKSECNRLYQFIKEGSQTSTFFQTDGIVTHLEKKGFIYKSEANQGKAQICQTVSKFTAERKLLFHRAPQIELNMVLKGRGKLQGLRKYLNQNLMNSVKFDHSKSSEIYARSSNCCYF